MYLKMQETSSSVEKNYNFKREIVASSSIMVSCTLTRSFVPKDIVYGYDACWEKMGYGGYFLE